MPRRFPVSLAPALLAAALLLPAMACHHAASLPAPDAYARQFSGDNALAHVAKLVALGPHVSGSPELEKARQYIEGQLQGFGWTVERQKFTEPTPHGPIEFVNLIARPSGASPKDPRALVCTHYDTKYFAPPQVFVGADDGGSGTGALIELARVLSRDPDFARRFELVFFDGEEAISQFRVDLPPYDGLWGSRYYAHSLSKEGRAHQFKLGILWDMIGKKDVTITLSADSPPNLARGIFAASTALGTRSHFGYYPGSILDDNNDLNTVGVTTIDLIDFNYPPWHTPRGHPGQAQRREPHHRRAGFPLLPGAISLRFPLIQSVFPPLLHHYATPRSANSFPPSRTLWTLCEATEHVSRHPRPPNRPLACHLFPSYSPIEMPSIHSLTPPAACCLNLSLRP